MVMIKNGKPVVPAAGNKQSQDIYAPKTNFEGGKNPKEMKTITKKMPIEDGFSHQYRNTTKGADDPGYCDSDEISRNGK